jgi:hypothetical protein
MSADKYDVSVIVHSEAVSAISTSKQSSTDLSFDPVLFRESGRGTERLHIKPNQLNQHVIKMVCEQKGAKKPINQYHQTAKKAPLPVNVPVIVCKSKPISINQVSSSKPVANSVFKQSTAVAQPKPTQSPKPNLPSGPMRSTPPPPMQHYPCSLCRPETAERRTKVVFSKLLARWAEDQRLPPPQYYSYSSSWGQSSAPSHLMMVSIGKMSWSSFPEECPTPKMAVELAAEKAFASLTFQNSPGIDMLTKADPTSIRTLISFLQVL